MLGEACCYTLLYCLLCLVLVLPPDEIAGMGLTVESILGSWLGSEIMAFVQFHQRRTAATLIIHSLLLPGYILMMSQSLPRLNVWLSSNVHPSTGICLLLLSVVPVCAAAATVWWWRRNNWRRHPLSRTLTLFTGTTSQPGTTTEPAHPDAWLAVATEINIQYRRVDKFSTRVSSTSQLVATDDWLIQVCSYRVAAMPLRDALVVLEGALTSSLVARTRAGNPQTLRLRARCITTSRAPTMSFRLSSRLWGDLERKLVTPVVNTGQVVVQQSLADQFLEAFITTVSRNPPFLRRSHEVLEEEDEVCIGCMASPANVKLDRRCGTTPGAGAGARARATEAGNRRSDHCLACSCRPMWCLECMSKWFAARQDQDQPETWLASRAPCPTCRSPFCLLDVRVIEAGT